MTIGDVAQLIIAVTALAVAIYAVRRDRAILRARFLDGAMGTMTLSVVNIGLRAVRVERVVRRHGWIRVRDEDYTYPAGALAGTTPLPVIVQPGYEIIIPVQNEEMLRADWRPTRSRWLLEDASGRRHRIQ